MGKACENENLLGKCEFKTPSLTPNAHLSNTLDIDFFSL